MKRFIIIGFYILMHLTGISQNNKMFVGTNTPLFYSFGYEQKVSDHFAINGQAGVLTKPYDEIILNILKSFDNNELLTNTIGDAFSYGLNFQTSLKWYIKKSYVGLSYSYVILIARDCPTDLIQDYYGISILNWRTSELTLQSNLHNMGILFGRAFDFKNPHYSINVEFSLLKTFASKSTTKNGSGNEIETLSYAIDNKLSSFYINYGYLPSLNIFFVYHL